MFINIGIKRMFSKHKCTADIASVVFGNSLDKLRHPRSVAYSAEQVLLNKQQISGGGADLNC